MADFGEILKSIGDFGIFQKTLLFALCTPNIIFSFHFASVLFVESDPERHCNTDWILKVGANLTTEEQLNLTLPRDEDGTFSRCQMFIPVDWDIDAIRDYGLNETTSCQNGWMYSSKVYQSTIVTDVSVHYSAKLAQSVYMAGILVGCLLFGPFAESFGRKRGVQIPAVTSTVLTVVTGLSPNFYLYLASQFIVGISYGAFRLNCIILATEWMGVSRRSWAACLAQLCGALGQSVVAGLVYFIRDWRLAQMTIAALSIGFAVYIWFIPESARWLLDRGRTEEAKKLITKVANINRHTIQSSLMEKVTFFFTIAMFGLSELPAHILCIWVLEAVGRKVSLMSTLLIGGVLCLLILAFPQGNPLAVTILAMAGRIFTNLAGNICNLLIQELFPTCLLCCRQTASGLGSIVSRAGGLLAPLLNMLALYHWSIPTIVFSSLLFISGALSFLLPETRQTDLPDSTEESLTEKNLQIFLDKRTICLM
uniref:Solute carrier family 22 member 13-like n=1 Tax=Gouania willdenowi TaxID=441366 RepID=A0A8C5HW78_GOUWI